MVKSLPADAGDAGVSPGLGRSFEKEMTTHSSILAWTISWAEKPGGLQSMGSQRAGHDLMTKQQKQLAPVFLPIIPSLPEISSSLLSLGSSALTC